LPTRRLQGCCRWGCDVGIWFEDFQTTEFLIQRGERLEFLCFLDLLFEPVLDLDLLNFFQILMIIVQMSNRGLLETISRLTSGEFMTYLFSCSSVIISSLHIGHISLELADAAAVEPRSAKAIRELISSSCAERGVLDACELSDSELSEGDSRLPLRGCGGRRVSAAAGDSD